MVINNNHTTILEKITTPDGGDDLFVFSSLKFALCYLLTTSPLVSIFFVTDSFQIPLILYFGILFILLKIGFLRHILKDFNKRNLAVSFVKYFQNANTVDALELAKTFESKLTKIEFDRRVAYPNIILLHYSLIKSRTVIGEGPNLFNWYNCKNQRKKKYLYTYFFYQFLETVLLKTWVYVVGVWALVMTWKLLTSPLDPISTCTLNTLVYLALWFLLVLHRINYQIPYVIGVLEILWDNDPTDLSSYLATMSSKNDSHTLKILFKWKKMNLNENNPYCFK